MQLQAKQTTREDRILSRCQHILRHLMEDGVIMGRWALKLELYILRDEEAPPSSIADAFLLTDYDGVTHFNGPNESASHIGLRCQCQDGRPYKEGAIIGTFLHELAHALDGYQHNGKLAHGPSFYQHYVDIVASASKANLFYLPRGYRGMNQKSLQRFDDLSPFSDGLDTCLPYKDISREEESICSSRPSTSLRRPTGPLRVTLCCGGVQKVATIQALDTTNCLFEHLTKTFQQKFPKTFSKRKSYEFQVTAQDTNEAYAITRANGSAGYLLWGGETIQYSSLKLGKGGGGDC